MECTFCTICDGNEDAVILDETSDTLVFAPLNPISEGHLLVIPKEHYATLADVPAPTLCAVMEHAKAIAERLRSHGFDGVNLLHASGKAAQQSVPHLHVHLTPRRTDDELDLWPESTYEESAFERTYEKMQEAIADGDLQ